MGFLSFLSRKFRTVTGSMSIIAGIGVYLTASIGTGGFFPALATVAGIAVGVTELVSLAFD